MPEGAGEEWWQEGCGWAVGAVKFQHGSEQQVMVGRSLQQQ